MSSGQSRAFLFGLTLTELMILFVFLMALLVGVAKEKQRELEIVASAVPELERELSIATEVATHAQTEIDNARSEMQTEQRIRMDLQARLENLKREMERIRVETGSAHALMAVLDEQYKADFQKFLVDAKAVVDGDGAEGELIRALQETLEEPASRRELLAELNSLRVRVEQEATAREYADQATRDAIEMASHLEENSELLRRRAEHYRKKLANGRGVDLPPCWLSESGSTEYLFTATMKASGYRLDPAWVEHRQPEAMAIPSVKSLSGRTLSSREFLAKTRPILDWSDERECRHFIRVVDDVGTDKELYKRQLQRLEQRFYKYLLN